MSPNFYIHKYIKIEHTNGISYYELYMVRGYFCDDIGTECYDSDTENLNEDGTRTRDPLRIQALNQIYNDLEKYCLTPNKEHIIFENNEFINDTLKEKYLPIVQSKISKQYQQNCVFKDTGRKLIDISTITKITKFETRTRPIYG